MNRKCPLNRVLLVLMWLTLLAGGCTQQAMDTVSPSISAPEQSPIIEPRAVDILKASFARLAAAKTLQFKAVVFYENPSRSGPPLVYTTSFAVTVQRPDKMKVLTPGDGPASEFYYDGKTMTAFSPAEKLVAQAKAPPTIDAMLEAAYRDAAIYFPFTDVIVAGPFKDLSEGLTQAFYIGQSRVVGNTTTDMVAYETDGTFVQIWIGIEDKLPRLVRAVYRGDPMQLRHVVEFSAWQIDKSLPADTFAAADTAGANHIPFDRPDAVLPADMSSAPAGVPASKQ